MRLSINLIIKLSGRVLRNNLYKFNIVQKNKYKVKNKTF